MKARVKLTGQIIDLIPYEKRSIRCSRQVQLFMAKDGKTFSEFEVEFDKGIDWEQRRYEIAKDMLAALGSNINSPFSYRDEDMLASCAIGFADELIKQLKENKE